MNNTETRLRVNILFVAKEVNSDQTFGYLEIEPLIQDPVTLEVCPVNIPVMFFLEGDGAPEMHKTLTLSKDVRMFDIKGKFQHVKAQDEKPTPTYSIALLITEVTMINHPRNATLEVKSEL